MTTSIKDLTTPTTPDQAKASIYDTLAVLGVDTTSWRPGAVVRTIITAVAILFAATTKLIAEIAKSAFLETAAGDWLTLVARYVYRLERFEPTFATAQLAVVNTGGGIYDLDPGDLVVRNPATDAAYTNLAAIKLTAGASISIGIVAVEAGSDSTSAVGAISELVTALPGVGCSNLTAAVGLDAEQDDSLRQRCRDWLGARSSNGPADAHAFKARNAKRADGTPIGVNRMRIVKNGKGTAFFYVATASGDVAAEDLPAVREAIAAVAPPGFTPQTVSARRKALDVTYRIWLDGPSGMTDAELEAKIAKAIGAYLAQVPIGGYVIDAEELDFDVGPLQSIPLEGVRNAIGSASPRIYHVELLQPTEIPATKFEDAPTLGTIVADSITLAPQEQVIVIGGNAYLH